MTIFIGNDAFVRILQLIEKILKPKGIGTTTAVNIGAIMDLAGVVGCIVIPAISDILMKHKPFIILAAAVAVPTLFPIGASSSLALIFASSIVVGFLLFSAHPLVLTFAEETTGSSFTGTATSILLLLGNVGGSS